MSEASFDRVAPYYDRLARLVFGQKIVKAQCYYLDRIPPGALVLVVGGGTGWLLSRLLDSPTIVHITYLEASEAMLRLAQQEVHQRRLPTNVTVDFIHGDEQSLTEGYHFSVVITNFVLDMYEGEELDKLIARLATCLTPGGYWLLTDFRLSEQKKHRWWQRFLTKAMYLFFHLTTGMARQSLPSYQGHLAKADFHLAQEQSFFADFIVSQVYKREDANQN